MPSKKPKRDAAKGSEAAASRNDQSAEVVQHQVSDRMHCVFCKKEIHKGERRYYSRQAGMKGLYHWDCFISACRHANKLGAQEIETITVNAGLYDNFSSYDVVDE